MSYRLLAIAAAAIVLEGCAGKPPPPPAPAEDLNVGIAKSCTFSQVQPAPGGSVNATINMTNDGWCALRVTEADGQPFALGLIRQRPEHGTMLIQKLGGQTRLEYTPAASYIGSDAFTAALRPRAGGADAMVQVAVTVTRGEGVPAAAAPAEETKPSSTTSRSSSSSRSRSRRTTP
ncbi:MAG: hypothetical protein JOZ05_19560 [Acetobacteraceae bacterium]|nr:hypothetical protein [Acetobacteraceae bacterium]